MDAVQGIQVASKAFGLEFTDKQREQLSSYVALLHEWSERVRLISRNDRALIWEQHVLDCLSIVPRLDTLGPLVDLGSGAGLPGLVIKIMRPDLEVCLLEPARMKSLFLHEAIERLGLEKVLALRSRAEALHQDPAMVTKFDVATARAVAPLPQLWDWVSPLLRKSGRFIGMKGPGAVSEFGDQVPESLEVSAEELTLPLTGRKRCFVVIERKI